MTPGSEYLLVEVSGKDTKVEAALERVPGVRGVTVHGDHRTHAERRDGTPMAPPS